MKKFYTFIIALLISLTCMFASNISNMEPISERIKTEYRAENLNHNLSNSIKTIKIEVPSTMKIYTGENFNIGIRTFNKDLYKDIKYHVTDSVLNIWIDNLRPEEINLMKSDEIRIKVTVPHNVSIITNSNLSVTQHYNKNKYVADYENN